MIESNAKYNTAKSSRRGGAHGRHFLENALDELEIPNYQELEYLAT